MKIVTTFHQPSSVLSSLKCQLSSRDLEHLVIAKLNKIDVYALQPYGLQHRCGLEVWGKILSIKSVPITGSSRSNLVLMMAHPDPELIFLEYTEPEAGAGELIVRKQLSLHERTPRPAEFYNDILVHPSGKLAVVSCYTGKLKIIRFKGGNYERDFDVSLPELNVFALAFLPVPDDEYALAILHLDSQERVQLLARDILIEDYELSPHPSTVLQQTSISAKILPFPTDAPPQLIPVPVADAPEDVDEEEGFLGGVLVVGGRKILLYELSSMEGRAKRKNKRKRLELKKKSGDPAEVSKAMQKEKEREARVRKAFGSVEWPWGEVTATCAIDQNTPRYFIGDSFGRLSMLFVDQIKIHGLLLIPLGETSPSTTLTYLTNQTLFVGSHLGDSQLLHISPTPTSSLTFPTLLIPPEIKAIKASKLVNSGKGKGKATDENDDDGRDSSKGNVVESMGSFITVLDTFKNIAPIMDATLVDTDGSGQGQIVTCSGGSNTGSISVIRNGADFQELASVPGLTGVTNIWAIRDQYEDETDSHILVSTLHRTHLFKINDAGSDNTLSQVKNTDLTMSLPTLAFGNMARPTGKGTYGNSELVVQVTRQGAFLLRYDMSLGTYVRYAAGWEANGVEVVAASVNSSQVLLALSGGRLVELTVKDDGFKVLAQRTLGSEISTVSCTPLSPSKFFSNYVTVSYWGSNTIEIFMLDPSGFVSVSKSPPLPALVRSVILHNFGSDHSSKGSDYHPYLLAGLGDGSVAFISWKDKQLKDKNIISLGHAPVSLITCQIDGKRTVFAAGTRATIFSWEKKRLHNSPITLREVAAISCLNTSTFKSSLILGNANGLFIGCVRELDKIHIRSIPLGLDNPRKIAYQPSLKVFGVACTRTEPGRLGDPELSKSSFQLLDDVTFSNRANFNCDPDEEISVLASFSPTINNEPMPLFCLGTFTYEAGETEPTNGRLLIFTAYSSETQSRTSNLQLSLVTSTEVRGCVYSIAIVKDMIVAAVNSSVVLYQLKSPNDVNCPPFSMQQLSEWNHNYRVTSLAAYGDHIMAGDQISSVSLLQIADSKIQNIARDYGPLWPVSIEASDEENIIGANDALNLFTFTLNRTMGRGVLERDGTYHLADLVTKFIRGSLTVAESSDKIATLEPKHIFFTSSGRIGVLVDVADPQLSLHLTGLQRNLAGTVQGIGGVGHTRFRAPRNTRGRSDADQNAFGFIDGDFLEQFLTHLGSPGLLERIVAGNSEPERLTMPVEEIQKILENLQGMH